MHDGRQTLVRGIGLGGCDARRSGPVRPDLVLDIVLEAGAV